MTFTSARTNSSAPNRTPQPAVSEEEYRAAKQAHESMQKLNDDLRRQLKEEIGEEEDVPEGRMQLLRQKFGISNLIATTPIEKYWVKKEETVR